MKDFGGSWAKLVLVFAGASVALGCGGDDPAPDKPDCGTTSNPDLFVLGNVEPAAGASVPNANIVHRFKLVGIDGVLGSLTFGLPAAHTAGQSIPSPTMWQPTQESDGFLYTSGPTSWTTAPGHVEVQVLTTYQSDGCWFAFPTPLFSYEITAP